jgi:ferritin-like metal-binding protein YciE
MPTKSNAAKKSATKKSTPSKAAAKNGRTRTPGNPEPALQEFFTEELKDIYWAEKKLVTSLPKMQKAATSEELKNAIGDHIEATRGHVSRLEEIFGLLGKKAQAKKCDAMEGILKEGESVIEDTEKGTATRDVGIILSSQKVEHYEIATYGALAQLAKTLGLSEVKELLGATLNEEKEADELLTGIAENNINYEAATEGEEEMEEEEVEA